ncbi:MAG TPA: lmo0937 family membrane protein [Puia sp.]|nr:lmo0937 family membrane protein [Puia sp.]
MGNLLYFIAAIIVMIWAIGVFGYGSGGIIHILIVIAVIMIVIKFIKGKSI